METIRLIGRNSRLSVLQLQVVKRQVEIACPGINVQIIARSSRGDELKDIPLQTVEGSDFFTQDIFDALQNGEADIAVHSLKDMSSDHFFGTNHFAVVDRDDVRDVAVFNAGVVDKIKEGKNIVIGTCSPRREEMAIGFLQKALPQLNSFKITTAIIRGNVDTRLQKLDAGEYDGIILAAAGLNRLLRSEDDTRVRNLLADKKLMLLPLIECVPAPCQGAIVAEAHPSNIKAMEVLKKINDKQLMSDCINEKRAAAQYGVGCLQKFGVTSFLLGNKQFLYAAGTDSEGNSFTSWNGLPEPHAEEKNIFSTADHMGQFFNYEYFEATPELIEPVVYIANYKAIQQQAIVDQLQAKNVWAAGTKTWFELAKKRIWVQGCADALGLEALVDVWEMPLLTIKKDETALLTNEEAKANWQQKGWNVYSSYTLLPKKSTVIEEQISKADIIFWTSFRQYEQYTSIVKDDVIHICSFGETAALFHKAGITPVVFPTIKAFQQWKQTTGRSRNAA